MWNPIIYSYSLRTRSVVLLGFLFATLAFAFLELADLQVQYAVDYSASKCCGSGEKPQWARILSFQYNHPNIYLITIAWFFLFQLPTLALLLLKDAKILRVVVLWVLGLWAFLHFLLFFGAYLGAFTDPKGCLECLMLAAVDVEFGLTLILFAAISSLVQSLRSASQPEPSS